MENNIFHKLYLYKDEYWTKITDSMIPGIRPNYWISNKGRVYSEYIHNIMKTSLDHNGYEVILLSLYNGIRRMCKVHRLVALAFIPYSIDPNYLQVNHKDGEKINNYDYNLEWSTPKENIEHAISTGLRNTSGEHSHTAILDDKTVRDISQLLLNNVSYKDIAIKLNLPTDHKSLRRIERIKNKETWNCVTKDYDFSNYNPNKELSVFTREEIHMICKYFEEFGTSLSILQVMNLLGKEEFYMSLSPRNKSRYCRALSRIRNKGRYQDIISQYNF